MRKYSLINTIFVLIFLSSCLNATTLTLGYPEFKPYTYTVEGKPSGLGVDYVEEIAKQIGIKVKFEPVDSYGNGVNWLRLQKIDGLFLASKNKERDSLAEFSEPLTVNRWVWITKKENNYDFTNASVKNALTITTHTNANTHIWLQKNNYLKIYPTTDVDAMVRQLMHKRIDTVFMAEEVFLEALKKSKWSMMDINITVEIAKPFGVYISHNYLEQNEDFMAKFNSAINSIKGK